MDSAVGDLKPGAATAGPDAPASFFRKRRPYLPSMPTRPSLLLAACLAALPARAATSLHYTARLRGVAFFDATYCLRLDAASYDAQLTARTLGLADFLVHGRVEGRAQGAVSGATLVPHSYVEHGRVSGEEYDLSIGYPGGVPQVERIAPPAEKYRRAVPPALLAGAIDGMSAIALETLAVTRESACQGSALVFDGRQLRRLTTHTAGRETLAPSGRSVFAGPALRCDTVSEMLAGYLKDESETRQARPRSSKAWLAAVAPGGPAVPVRFAFDADFLGDILVDLDGVGVCGA